MKRTKRLSLAATMAVVAVLTALTIGAFAAPPEPDPAQRRGGATGAAPAGAVPFRAPVAGAPQTELDAALYVVEPFFDVSARLSRPYAEARPLVAALGAKYSNDPRVQLHLARLDVRLGGFDVAVAEMEKYASLAGREPNALRRLASFYRSRAMAGPEIRTLEELAAKLPVPERPPVYRRAIEAFNDGRPTGFIASSIYEKLLDSDPTDGGALRDYVSLLLISNDEAAALAAIDRVTKANPQPDRDFTRVLLSERARVHDRAGRRKEAVAVYEQVFDPLWPRAIAADYYTLLSRYGIYRERRRALQQQVAGGAAPLSTVGRLFNFYAYEGNLPAAGRLLTSLESTRKGAWPATDLELAASLYGQIGDFDQASRYVYSLYLQGGFAPGSAERERVLSRLFTALISAREGATRLAPGGITLYADIARIDPRPGALNGLLSLILAGNNPAAEFALEEARAGGYLNRALANSIYEQFRKEYPASPLIGGMTVDLLDALADLGAHRDVVAVGSEFMRRFPDSKAYEAVALAVADAHVALKARPAERAVIQGLLDRLAARQPANRPLLDRSTSRWIYRPDPTTAGDGDEEGDEPVDAPPDVFVAPNGTPVTREEAGQFASGTEEPSDDFEPTQGGSGSSDDNSNSEDDYRGQPDRQLASPSYGRLLERMVSSYETDKQQAGALAFLWSEVKKHPKDEGLMERFLAWLGGTSLVNDQVRAYRTALERYDDGTWLHRFARWHVRQGRGAEIRRLTEQVIRTLDDESVAAYLENFAGYGGAAKGDSLDWDNAIALQMARLAHTRFPNNVSFVKTMLSRLATAEDWTEWERLSREYYFGDPTIRSEYLKRLSETTKLDGVYAAARERAAGGLDGGASSAFAYAVLAADSARWLSRFDESLAAYRHLVALYPGEPAYAEPLADLTRSFGSRDPKFYVEASKVLDDMALRYPSDHRYATQSGEVLASAGDMAEATKRWESIGRVSPGSPAVRLEVATIFWDYYQFDYAAEQLLAVRNQTRDDSLYAFRLGAVFDSKHDLTRAIPEYVKTLGEPGEERSRAAIRLAELSRRDGVLAQVASAYEAQRRAKPAEWQLAIGYADFLRALDRTGEAVGALNREVASSHDVAFLEEARDRFRQWRSTESEERALRRLGDEARDERERIRARLQLAAFLEQQSRAGDASGVFDQLVADNPTNAGVLEEATRFYWRAGQLDKSAALSRTVIAKAQGEYKKRFVTELARRQADAGRLGDAEATLRTYFDENALDMEIFGALAKVLGDAKRDADLATLYATALKRVREANLDEYSERDQVASLRTGMIASLTALNRYQEGVDQQIEIVNCDAESVTALDTAYDYAARYDLVPRLVGYYEKLAKDSFKDYRWSLVLGRLYDRTGNAAGAAEAFRRAVTNEPQRTDLRGVLADALVRAGRDEDAVAELRRAWELDGRDPQWLVSVARIRIRQGRLDDASKTIDEAIAARESLPASRLFFYANTVAGWGLLEKATGLYEKGIEAARQKPGDYFLSSDKIAEYARVAVRARSVADVFAKLESQRRAFESTAAAPNNYDASSARYIASAFDEVERKAFADLAVEYGSVEERAALDAALRTAAASSSDVDGKRRYLGVAQTAGLAGAEEAIELQIVDRALATFDADKGVSFHSSLTEMSEMYTRRTWYARSATQLAAYRAKDKQPGDYDYDRRIAAAYRLAGDTTNEIAALERLYAAASGDRATGENERTTAVERLFGLLVATNQRDRLVTLAGTQSPYQFVLINFLIERGDEELARRAIASANVSPVWVKAQTAEVGLFFRNASPEVEAAFRDALHARPIGELVATKFDPQLMLSGSDYYLTARNYGLWLDLVANRPDAARDYLMGRVEERPRDASAQTQLARFYLARQNNTAAMSHVDLAAELAPTDRNVIAVRGEVLHASGRTADAIAEWQKLVNAEGAGSEDYQLYFAEMSAYGHFDRALTDLRRTIANRIYVGKYAEVSDLVDSIAAYGSEHPEARPTVSDALYGIAVESTDDILLLRNVLSNDLVPVDRQGPFYRLLTDRLEGLAAAVASNPDGDNGISVGDDYLYPAEELGTWRKLAADYLIRRGSLDEATKLLDSIEAERRETAGGLAGDNSDDYTWVELARATILLKSNRKADAVVALERYCAPRGADGAPTLPDRTRCDKAVAVLQANGAQAEADAMLESVYRRLIDARQYDVANYTGLAEVLYRRGRIDEADATLRGLAARNPDSSAALAAAGDAAARAGRYQTAIELREAAARVARGDASNALELARLRAIAGDAGRAVVGFAEVAGDDRAPNSIRAQAVDLAAEIAAKDAGARTALTARLGAGKTEHERVLAAMISGSPSAGLEPLAAAGSTLAAIELGRVELAAGRSGNAITAFERAIASDERGTLASAIAFGGATPAESLIQLYTAANRPDAAVAIGFDRSAIFQTDDGERVEGIVFEPDIREVGGPVGLQSLGDRNWNALRAGRTAALGALADSAARIGLFDQAVGYARRRLVLVAETPDAAKAQTKLDELMTAQRDAARRASGLLRVGTAIATDSVAIKEFTLD